MPKEDYKTCMATNMGGGKLKGLSKEDRRIAFCVIAKKCSKGMSEGEARQICLLPKKPKPPKVSKRVRESETDVCDPNQFFEIASQFSNLYIDVNSERCQPCHDLNTLIKEAEIPFQIVQIPEDCVEIIDKLGIESFPTVVKMSKGKIVARHDGRPEDTIELMKKGL